MATALKDLSALKIIAALMPEFKTVDDSTKELYIELVRSLASKAKFKGQYEYAVALLACHKMKLNGLGDGIAGTNIKVNSIQGLASVAEGGTSVSFTGTGADSMSDEYSRTMYGVQYLNLVKQCITTITIEGVR
ncbi:MAG: DUF4054 domain-containing protein [Lachnospiraceae bacterium]